MANKIQNQNVSVTQLLNKPVPFVIAGQTYNLTQLSIGEIFALAEAEVRKNVMDDAQEIAKTLQGTDKISFLRGILQDLPKGEALRKACDEWLNTPAGLSAIFETSAKKSDPNFSADVLASMLKSDNIDELALAVQHILGSEIKENKEEDVDTEKKTT